MTELYLSRSHEMDFVRREGLQKLTSVTAHEWDIYILKELVDNALDADEALDQQQHGRASPHVKVEMIYDGVGLSVSVANKAAFPLAEVEHIFDLQHRVSVKDYYNRPTRGAQGNALKTILGIPYALQYYYQYNYEPRGKPLTIQSGAEQIKIGLGVDECQQLVQLEFERRQRKQPSPTTQIRVNLYNFTQERPRTVDALHEMAQAFALWNPHASFDFTFVVDNTPYSYMAVADATWTGKYDLRHAAPIWWYSYTEFRELLHALLAYAQTHRIPEPTLADVARQFGLSGEPHLGGFVPSTPLARLRAGSRLQHTLVTDLYAELKRMAANEPAPALGAIGEQHLRVRTLTPADAPAKPGPFFYTQHCSPMEDRSGPPFVLEVSLSASNESRRHVLAGINHSPTYRDPFFNKPLVPPGQEEPQRGLEKLLDYYDLRETSGVVLAVHLIAPAVTYENYGKSAINDDPYRTALMAAIHTVVQAYKEAMQPVDTVDRVTEPAQKSLPVVLRSLDAMPFSEGQLLSALKRHLRASGDPDIVKALADVSADGKLRAVIEAYHRTTRIPNLIAKKRGRLWIPNHPTDALDIAIADHALDELLYKSYARAIIIPGRQEIEDLLVALRFPVRYDVAILRSEGALQDALAVLAERIRQVGPVHPSQHASSVIPLWVVRDATIEGARIAAAARERLRAAGVADTSVIDIGLHPDDTVLDSTLMEPTPSPVTGDAYTWRSLGLDEREIAFYLSREQSARVESLASPVLDAWFLRRLDELGESPKLIPDVTSMQQVASQQVEDQFRSIVKNEAFESLGLDSIVSDLAVSLDDEFAGWMDHLPATVLDRLRDQSTQTWRSATDAVVTDLLREFLSRARAERVRERVRSGS